MTMMNTK